MLEQGVSILVIIMGGGTLQRQQDGGEDIKTLHGIIGSETWT